MTDKTQIWYLIGTLERGGAEKTLVDLANNLPQSEYEVTVWTIQDIGELRSGLDDHVTYRSLSARNKADLGAIIRFARAVRTEQPAIVQSFLFFDNVVSRLSGIANPDTVVVTGVRSVPDRRQLQRWLFDRLTLPLSDHVVSNSEAGAEWITDSGVSRENVSVVYNGREIDQYAAPESPPDLYDELEVGEGPVVGTVGRLIERKGHYDLLEAWPSVLENNPTATLLFVGDGPEREGLERRTKTLGCASSVRFLGMRDDVPELLDLMDVFVFPSHFEGLPGALIEAMAAGLPIVCTPVDGNAELVVDGESGVFVPTHVPEEIAAELDVLLSEHNVRRNLGRAAAARARATFSIELMVEDSREVYERILSDVPSGK